MSLEDRSKDYSSFEEVYQRKEYGNQPGYRVMKCYSTKIISDRTIKKRNILKQT